MIKRKVFKLHLFVTLFVMLFQNFSFLAIAVETTPTETTPTEVPTAVPTAVETVTPTPEITSTVTPVPTTEATPSPLATEIPPSPTPETTSIITQAPTPTVDIAVGTSISSNANSGNNVSNSNQVDENQTNTGSSTAEVNGSNQVASNNQSVSTNNQTSAAANTGANQANDNQSRVSVITTGDAVAFVNLVNFLHSSVNDSDIKISIIDLSAQSGNANIDTIWKDFLSQSNGQVSMEPSNLQVVSGGTNTVSNTVDVKATSGANTANNNGGIVVIQTGNAVALANVINLINTNLVASKYMISIVNITDFYQGNIILPRPDTFGNNTNSISNNDGGITVASNTVSASANSGSNATASQNSSNMSTGVSVAIINNQTIINTTVNGNQFHLIINNLGEWQGAINGWQSSSDSQQMTGYYAMLATGSQTNGENNASIINSGINIISNQITVTANTGNNQLLSNSESSLTTGNSIAMANLFNFVNFNYYQSHSYFGILNILGKWKGDIVFAYPDMMATITPIEGRSDNYEVSYKNIGYDAATNVALQLELPENVTIDGKNHYQWDLGTVAAGNGGFVDLQLAKNSQTASLHRLIGEIWAAEGDQKLPIKVKIVTSDPELDLNNNHAEAWITVDTRSPSLPSADLTTTGNTPAISEVLPQAEISISHNVNGFVYAGDTVTYEAKIRNTNDVKSYNNYLEHKIYDQNGNLILQTTIELGDIGANEAFKINYSLELPADYFADGVYYNVVELVGKSQNNQEYHSNKAEASFGVKTKGAWAGTTRANGPLSQTKVLGVGDAALISRSTEMPIIWPYITLMLSSAVWLVINSQKKLLLMSIGKSGLNSWKYMGLFVIMLFVFGFATLHVVQTQSQLSTKLQYFSSVFKNVQIVPVLGRTS